MSFTRKKEIEMDGVTVVVAPLSCAQADEFLTAQSESLGYNEAGEKVGEVDGKRLLKVVYQFVCDGFNNANPDAKLTVELLKAQFDKVLIDKMADTIRTMSGLATKGEEKAGNEDRLNMAELRGLVVTAAGWTSKEFDEAPLPMVFDLLEYWGDNPPEHIVVAAQAGLKRRKRKKKMSHKIEPLKPIDEKQEALLPPWVREARQRERERREEALKAGAKVK